MPKHQYGQDVYVDEVKVAPGKEVKLDEQSNQPTNVGRMIDKALREKGK